MKQLSKKIAGRNLFFKQDFKFSWNHTTYLQKPGHGNYKNVTLIPGYGIGPELCKSVQTIMAATFCPVRWDLIDQFTFSNPNHRQIAKKNDNLMLGVIKKNRGDKYSDNIEFYKYLNLYVNAILSYSFPNAKLKHQGVDIVIIRENTEGEYTGIEHEITSGTVTSLKITTKAASKKTAKYAFEFAYLSGRQKVTAVHKANIMKIVDGLFLEACREVAELYPSIKYEEMIVDNCSMQLVKSPQQFDVMVMPNLYGSIISNICAGITGGVGMSAGGCIGEHHALFSQGTRHTGNDIAGQNQANPTAIILSSIMMLRTMNLPFFAETINEGLYKTYIDGKTKTIDQGGKSTTQQFTNEVANNCIKLIQQQIAQ